MYIYLANIFPMFHNPCMRAHLISLVPRYSLLDENNLPLHKGAPILDSCFSCASITLVETSHAFPPWNNCDEHLYTFKSSPRGRIIVHETRMAHPIVHAQLTHLQQNTRNILYFSTQQSLMNHLPSSGVVNLNNP